MIVNTKLPGKNENDYFNSDLDGLKKLREEFKTTKKNDVRITKLGRYLRSTSLDELPQILNILKGEMSFVGPRPDTPMQKVDYSAEQWAKRCSVKPGLTGLAQISGRSNITHNNRIKNDLIWVDKKSLILYLTILLKTPFVLFKNVY